MNTRFKPVKPKLITDQVFDQLRELIFRGAIKPGEKLLPERKMARKMNVSRATIRSAVQRLINMGLVTPRQGSGTYVRGDEDKLKGPLVNAMEFQDIPLDKLLEIRLPLECNAASLAAKRADKSDIKAIEQSFSEMASGINRGRLGSQADSSFHMAVAYASKNPLHILIIRSFYDYIFHGIIESLELAYSEPENIRLITDHHERILSAIKQRDPEQAWGAMDAHISSLIEFIL